MARADRPAARYRDPGNCRAEPFDDRRYQYTRNISSPRFADLVSRLLATGAEAAELWERHEVEIPPHEYSVRVRHAAHGFITADVALMPIYPRLWLYTMVLPSGIEPPD